MNTVCVIVLKPAGRTVGINELNQCFWHNDDGAGISWVEDGKLHLKKGFMDWESFYEFWISKDWTDITALLHFRITTHGDTSPDNTHPFWVFNDELVFAHNGMFSISARGSKSDTQLFNKRVLAQLPRDFLSNEGACTLLDKYCRGNSKLAFLRADGSYKIIGESAGIWLNGVWFSNISHKAYKKYVSWSKDDDDLDGSLNKSESSEVYNVNGYVYDRDDLAGSVDDIVASEILGATEWFCNTCDIDFTNNEIVEVKIESDGLLLPACPLCGWTGAVYCLDSKGVWPEEEKDGE